MTRPQYPGGCVTCQDTMRLAGEVIKASTSRLNEAYDELQAIQNERDRLRKELDEVVEKHRILSGEHAILCEKYEECSMACKRFADWVLG